MSLVFYSYLWCRYGLNCRKKAEQAAIAACSDKLIREEYFD